MLYEPSTGLHFSDSLSKLMGKHSLKMGFQADHYSIDNYQPNGVTGSFTFNGNYTGNPFSDYLFGDFSKTSKFQGQPEFVSSRAWSYAFFVQDDIKLTPKLTLNAGLRWQYDQSFHEIHHGDAFFDPCAVDYSQPGCVPHWDQFGVNAPDSTFDPSKHQFEPRIGISWNPAGGFVVRAGYGIMHSGFVGHGRAGDGQPGPELLWGSTLNGSVWDTATPALKAGAGFSPGAVYFWLTVNPGWWGLSSSTYHSLQAQFEHRFSHNFSMLSNFTWSKLIDDSSSDWGGFWSLDVLGQDFYNRRAERSVSAGDIPLRFTLAPIVELPLGPGKKWLNSGAGSQVLGGWRVSAIYTISDGSPFGITDNSYGFCNGAGVLSDRPMMIGNPLPPGFHQTITHWFDSSAFDFSGTCPASGLPANLVDLTGPFDVHKAFGNAPRYFAKVRNPGVNNFDFSLQKDFKIPVREQTRLTFSADFFNLPNHPEFAEPNSDPGVSNFGSISRTALNNRTIQLGLHLYF